MPMNGKYFEPQDEEKGAQYCKDWLCWNCRGSLLQSLNPTAERVFYKFSDYHAGREVIMFVRDKCGATCWVHVSEDNVALFMGVDEFDEAAVKAIKMNVIPDWAEGLLPLSDGES